MTALRRVLFWCHLAAGALAGVVILLLCVTGALLAFQPQVLAFLEREARAAPPSAAGERLPGGTLLLHASRSVPGSRPTAVTVPASSSESAWVAFGRERTLYLDPATGAVRGEASRSGRAFFAAVQDLHRWLLVPEKSRPAGKAVTGAANLAFFGLALTGLYIWWPRIRGIRRVSSVGLFQRGVSGKARDFNWHNVVGVWTAIPLLVLTATGMVISYRWAGDLVYRLAGSEPPPAQAPNARARNRGEAPPAFSPERAAALDRLWRIAEQQSPGWRAITLRLSESGAGRSRSRSRKAGSSTGSPVRLCRSIRKAARSSSGSRTPKRTRDARRGHGCVSSTRASLSASPARSSPQRLRRAARCSPARDFPWRCAASPHGAGGARACPSRHRSRKPQHAERTTSPL